MDYVLLVDHLLFSFDVALQNSGSIEQCLARFYPFIAEANIFEDTATDWKWTEWLKRFSYAFFHSYSQFFKHFRDPHSCFSLILVARNRLGTKLYMMYKMCNGPIF